MGQGTRNLIRIIAVAGLGLAVLGETPALAAPVSAAAPPTDISAQQQQPKRSTRITIVPLSRYYRKCDFWLAVEHRPSGDVITPQQHCWWALK